MKNLALLVFITLSSFLMGQMTPTEEEGVYELKNTTLEIDGLHVFPNQIGIDTSHVTNRLFIPYDVLKYSTDQFFLYPKLVGEKSPRLVPVFMNIGDVGYVFNTRANYDFSQDGKIMFVGKPVEYFLVTKTPEPSD